METERILSADSHVIELADVWTAGIDKRFLDRAPRVVTRYGDRDGDFFAAEGLRQFPVAGFAVARDFAGVPDDDRRKMIAENVGALYGIG